MKLSLNSVSLVQVLCGISFLVSISLEGCSKDESEAETIIPIDTSDWKEITHGKSSVPDYITVFPQNIIQRLDITISNSDWNAILSDLAGMPIARPGQTIDGTFDPIWVSCDLFFNDTQWYKVGIRVKGNSSLQNTYSSGNRKFSFKLDFEQFEDSYPEIKNQRFFGFKQLNLNNNFDDKSLMREKIAGDLFREFGVPAAKSSYYEIYINYNGESQYFGLYTLVEEVDNTVIKTQFASADGNLYKPEGAAASFAFGKYNTTDFYKKTNEDIGDWSDVKALFDALHSSLRTSDPSAWRILLESEINMDLFIRWLAANTVMQNWDTYGRMTHNYYLYNDPSTSLFVWIPWDNNESLQTGKMGGGIALNLKGVSSDWPLINFIASDAAYYALYTKYAKEFASTVFEPSKMYATYDYFNALIRESVLKEESGYTFLLNGESDFSSALSQLKQHVDSRFSATAIL
jgi:spore coat protein CotH